MDARVAESAQQQPSTPAISAAPPPPSRRPRVREVSSRFMSPVSSYSSSSSSSSPAGDLHPLTSISPVSKHPHHYQRSSSVQRQRRQLKMPEPDENRPAETARSLDSPFPIHSHHGSKTLKQHVQKPLKENGHRLDTPTPMAVPSSRLRLSQQRSLTASAAAKLLQSSGMSLSAQASRDKDSESRDGSSSTASQQSDWLSTTSNRSNLRFSSHVAASPLSRSLSSPISSCDDASIFRAMSLKNGAGLSLPPVAPSTKAPADTKKPKKAVGHQEDVHSLKLLHNRYLQWRFANAKAEVRMQSQTNQAERMLYSHGLKISELYESVQRKRLELGNLLRFKTLMAITEAQIPYLEEWFALEGDYSIMLSEAIQALLNASQRIPLCGNIRVDAKELGEALASATKLMETILLQTGSLMLKAEKLDVLISELAKVTSGERILLQECGDLLSMAYTFQIEESSLRVQLIQNHRSCISKPQEGKVQEML